MTMHVVSPGALTTLQDLGRYGFQRFGVSASGVMDEWSHRVANIIVGNDDNEATLEVTLAGPTLLFDLPCLISICGANLSPSIDGVLIPMWVPILVTAGSRLQFGRRIDGARAYIAVRGGYQATMVMNSKSTYLRCGFGGFEGRMLRAGDSFTAGGGECLKDGFLSDLENCDQPFLAVPSPEIAPLTIASPQVIRVVPGQQWEKFAEQSRSNFVSKEFRVTPQSDRMGYRIQGEALSLEAPLEMISEAVTFGTVQVPPDGNPIILMADRPTTGGYPKIATVVRVDLPLLAQIFAPGALMFALITIQEAQSLYLAREDELSRLRHDFARVHGDDVSSLTGDNYRELQLTHGG